MFYFKKWRLWLLGEVELQIAKYHGISFSNAGPIEYIDSQGVDELERTHSKSEHFLKRFVNLCRDFGFDPSNKKHWNKYELDEGRTVRAPESGAITLGMGKDSHAFYQRQKNRLERGVELLGELRPILKKRKPRLPTSIAKILVYSLEKNCGRNAELVRIRKYLGEGRFERDLNKISVSIRSKIRKFNKRHPKEGFPLLKSYPAPNNINQLCAARAEEDTHRWRAVWINDLCRLISSEACPKIKKKISKMEMEEIKKDVLGLGDKKM